MAIRWTQWPTSAFGSGMYCGAKAAVDRPPGRAAVIGAEHARRRDRDVASGPGGTGRSRIVCRPMPPAPGASVGRTMVPERRQLLPGPATVGRAEQRRVLHAGVDRVRVGQRRLQMPHALELPGMLGAVVPLVGAGRRRRTRTRCPTGLPGLAPVVRALDHLAEPPAGLRGIDPVRLCGRTLEVVHLPAREVRAAHVPPVALAVRREDERTFARADQYPYRGHPLLLAEVTTIIAGGAVPPIY